MKYKDKQMDMHNAKITKAYARELSAVIVSFLQKMSFWPQVHIFFTKNVILTTGSYF